jgi:F420H(2)-dependent quinone reductase
MSFYTPAGTRGGRQPRTGLMLRLINKNAASRFRRTGKMLGFNGLILTTVGARSGAERTSPVGWWPGPDGSWLIVAAANGAARNPRGITTLPLTPATCGSRWTAAGSA